MRLSCIAKVSTTLKINTKIKTNNAQTWLVQSRPGQHKIVIQCFPHENSLTRQTSEGQSYC